MMILEPTAVYELVRIKGTDGKTLPREWSRGFYRTDEDAWAAGGTEHRGLNIVRLVMKTVLHVVIDDNNEIDGGGPYGHALYVSWESAVQDKANRDKAKGRWSTTETSVEIWEVFQ